MDDEMCDDRAGRQDYLWTAGNTREAIPHAMTPCTWSIIQPYVTESAGLQFQAGHPLFDNIGGHLYMNLSVTMSVARSMGVRRIMSSLINQAFGPLPPDLVIPEVPVSRLAVLRTVGLQQLRVRAWTTGNAWRRRRMLDQLAATADRLLDDIPSLDSPAELRAAWDDEIAPMFRKACRLIRFTVPTWMTMAVAHMSLQRLVGQGRANVITAGSTPNGQLASLDLLVGLDELRDGAIDRQTFARRYGHRGPNEHELSAPRPGERPDWIDAQLGRPALRHTIQELRDRSRVRAETWAEIRRESRLRHAVARVLARSWGRSARTREHVRSDATRAFWVLRAFIERAGEITGCGEDLYMLTIGEVLEVLDGMDTPLANVNTRRAEYERHRAGPPPPLLFFGSPDNPVSGQSVDVPDDPAAPFVLSGYPGAPGTVRGVARVIADIDATPDLEPGEILIAELTNVGWTAVFPLVGAVVTDIGAALSHAAIVARELGIPAVVGCRTATQRIRTGNTVEVDGERGTVTVLDAVNPAG